MRSERRKRLSLAVSSNARRAGNRRAGVLILVTAAPLLRLTNPTTASSVTFMSKPASRAFARHASTWAFSATAAAIASASSFANRLTTSSIPASSSHRRRAGIRGVSRSEPAQAGEAWQGSGAKDVHLYGFSLCVGYRHCRDSTAECQQTGQFRPVFALFAEAEQTTCPLSPAHPCPGDTL